MNLFSLRKIALSRRRRLACGLTITLLACHAAVAQQQLADPAAGTPEAGGAGEVPAESKVAPLPDAPTPQDKRIMGVLPNYRTADGTVPFEPISAKHKLTIASKVSFDWPNYIIGGVFAGIYQMNKSHSEFGQGVAGILRDITERLTRTR